MRFLVMSKGGDGSGVAQRLAHEGNEVDLWIQEKRYARVGKGIVNRVETWERAAQRADVILCDCVGFGRWEDQIRETNKPYIGFCGTLDTVEKDRQVGMAMFERAGLAIPETYPFGQRREAARIPVEHGWGAGWVVKSDEGNVQDTRVVKDEALWEHAISKLPEGKCAGIAQRVVNGVEVSTEGWFNGSGWVTPFNHTFEEKRFMSGGVGCNTGCQGNVVINAGRGNRLTRATVEPMADLLRMIGYRGPFDVNAIVTKDEAYALEATSRLGFDAIEALLEGLEEPAANLFADVAAGVARSMPLTDDVMIAVRLSIPPYPFRNPNADSWGEPISGIDEHRLNHLFLCDVYREDDGTFCTAGAEGLLMKATAIGKVERDKTAPNGHRYKPDYTYEARRRVYRIVRGVSVDGVQYRDDIGRRVNDDIARLKEWGWLPKDL
jgi:phosphoribosylamine---glycine ligase